MSEVYLRSKLSGWLQVFQLKEMPDFVCKHLNKGRKVLNCYSKGEPDWKIT